MNKANECTCPSGDGSLRWPCPAHPAVEQAVGDERAAFELFVRKHCGMPEHIAVNWDAKFTNDAWEGWQARAALAQPSPAQAEQEEAERPEVVGYLATAEHPKHGQPHKAFNYFKDQHDAQVAHWRERGCTVTEDRLMTVSQHERIVGALRSEIAEWQEAAGRSRSDVVAYIAERAKLLEWAVGRWHAEVSLRPLINVHRRALDDTWRQVIRRLGGDTGLLCGPSHDELLAAAPAQGGE
ncbi:hypothetical protein KUC69_01420 [Pseudomonas aeruginosa]|uniref:hypothetical protein n=1 Tax=Pseudomonas aeruginosa TaxID=287 RepID=UPI0021E1889E|nr:hypothetical protein [Pseudomonas aeruginosa]MCV0057045.1 hypothetical protein [Pseudomonas aeruginosa]MCV0268184.1 hypothetical protein [Pseudomonas aeruginosa]